jgi:lysophospholipase L1-like esterase
LSRSVAPDRVPRRIPRLRLAATGIVFAFALLAAAELSLRALGAGATPVLVEVAGPDGPLLVRSPSAPGVDASAMAVAPDRLGSLKSKAAGRVRVIVVGESTVAGFPFFGQLSFSRLLEHALRRAGGDVEVVNFGRAADSSSDVAEAAIASLQLAPDVLVVSSGHNEFQASYVGALRDGAWPRLRTLLRELALVRAGQQRDWRTEAAEEEQLPAEAVADLPFLSEAEFDRGSRRYRDQLDRVAAAAARAGVPLVVMTQVANLAVAPCASAFRQPLAPDERAAYRRELAAAMERLADGAVAAGVSVGDRLEVLLQKDSAVALAQFAAARCREAVGDLDGARDRYRAALLLDAYPNRGGARLNEVIREFTRESGAALVDADAVWQRRGGAAPGNDLFLDYCHPNLEGIALLAETLLAGLLERKLLPPVVDGERALAWLREPADHWLESLSLTRDRLAGGLVEAALLMLGAAERTGEPGERWRLARSGFRQARSIAPARLDAALGAIATGLVLGSVNESLTDADKLWRSDPQALQKLHDQLPSLPQLASAIAAAGVEWRDGRLVRKP